MESFGQVVHGAALGLPQFDRLEVIGWGAHSTVYKAFAADENRHVAVKLLNVDDLDEFARRRFSREFETMAALSSHPNIVTLLEADLSTAQRPYIVMDYCPGGSYGQRLSETGPLDLRELLDLGVRIAGALATAHTMRIRHRDIKPENILVASHGPVLCDFGIAGLGDQASTQSAHVFTPFHMPPEPRHTYASDVYSLASTLYTLCEGRPPYVPRRQHDIFDLIEQIRDPSVAPEEMSARVPPSLAQVIMGGLTKEPEQRSPQTALAFARRLQGIQRELGHPVTDVPVPQNDPITGNPLDLAQGERSTEALRGFAPDEQRASGDTASAASPTTFPTGSPSTAEVGDTGQNGWAPPSASAEFAPVPVDVPSTSEPAIDNAAASLSMEAARVQLAPAPTDAPPLDDTIGRPLAPPQERRFTPRVIARITVVAVLAFGLGAALNLLRGEEEAEPPLTADRVPGVEDIALVPPAPPSSPSTSIGAPAPPSSPTEVRAEWSNYDEATVTWAEKATLADGYLLRLATYQRDPLAGVASEPSAVQYVGDGGKPTSNLEGLRLLSPEIHAAVIALPDRNVFTCITVIAANSQGVRPSEQLCLPEAAPRVPDWSYPGDRPHNVAPGPIILEWGEVDRSAAAVTVFEVEQETGFALSSESVLATATSIRWPQDLKVGEGRCFVMTAVNVHNLVPFQKGQELRLPAESFRSTCLFGTNPPPGDG